MLLLPPLILVLLTPLIYLYGRHYNLTCIWLMMTTAATMVGLDYVAGGVMAVGLMALGMGPVAGGVLLGRKGIWIGLVISFAAIAAVVVTSSLAPPPNINVELGILYQRSLGNVIVFTLMCLILFSMFLRQEERKRQIIEQQNGYINQLISVLTHDIASPLAVAKMKLDLIAMTAQIDAQTRRHFQSVTAAIELIAEQRQQVMEMRAADDNLPGVEIRPLNLKDMLLACLEFLAPLADAKQIRFTTDIRLEEELILASAVIFQQQIIGNLLGNAIKFSFRDGEIHIDAWRQGSEVLIEVRDHGMGIPEDILPHLFSLHEKTSRPGTESEPGTGYGLPIVKSFVEKLHGRVEIRSVEKKAGISDHGTCIRLSFPLAGTGRRP